jgi:Zinc finger, C2H2 type
VLASEHLLLQHLGLQLSSRVKVCTRPQQLQPDAVCSVVACAKCGKCLKNASALALHQLKHFKEPKKKEPVKKVSAFVCDEPGCVFGGNSAPQLATHWRRAHNLRVIWCKMCGAQCKNQQMLQLHWKVHFKKDLAVK